MHTDAYIMLPNPHTWELATQMGEGKDLLPGNYISPYCYTHTHTHTYIHTHIHTHTWVMPSMLLHTHTQRVVERHLLCALPYCCIHTYIHTYTQSVVERHLMSQIKSSVLRLVSQVTTREGRANLPTVHEILRRDPRPTESEARPPE